MSKLLRFHPEGLLELEHAGETCGSVFAAWPYSIFYAVDEASVLLIAFAHDRREPGYWVPRL